MKLPPPPRLTGRALRGIVRATDADPVRYMLGKLLRGDLGIDAVRALPESARGPQPLHARPEQARRAHPRATLDLALPDARPHARGSAAWLAALHEGKTTSSELTDRAITAVKTLASQSPMMSPMLYVDEERARRDAAASTERHKSGRAIGPLDGVIVPVKEEVDLEGRGATLGLKRKPAPDAKDATVVRWLREAGAIVLGHTSMTEDGMSPLGVSVQRLLPRNAVDPRYAAGGSSTGSAVAVATGLCPVALGSDGGGSIRLPASFNGLFGLKPTFGRISRAGDGFGGTMAHLGPIGCTTQDLALFLEATSGEDKNDELTLGNPGFDRGWLVAALRRGVRGLRIGVLEDEIDAAEPAVAAACRDALRALETEGAKLVPISISLARHAPAIGYLSIGLEAYAELAEMRRTAWDDMGVDLQLLCRVMSTFGSDEYLDAQRLRAGLRREVAQALREVDALAMPTSVRGAPEVSDADMRDGMTDTTALQSASRFVYIGNLCGLPAGTAPVGLDARGMPVGLQILGDAWDEATVLQVLAHLERTEVARCPAPRVKVDLFG
ncbi:MAG: amidase [Sandaracinaceae bacterium]|nr:amidase [Sandaracinaceae bacterium]